MPPQARTGSLLGLIVEEPHMERHISQAEGCEYVGLAGECQRLGHAHFLQLGVHGFLDRYEFLHANIITSAMFSGAESCSTAQHSRA